MKEGRVEAEGAMESWKSTMKSNNCWSRSAENIPEGCQEVWKDRHLRRQAKRIEKPSPCPFL